MVTNIDRAELLRMMEEEGAQVVNVLPAQEYASAHIPESINIPLKRLDAETTSVLRRDKPVVVH
ncbi:MAG: rhodanese-like domain-containing protein [Acidimicrobiales bacterium]